MFWQCPANAAVLTGTAAADTEVHNIAAQDPALACLWLRGLLPIHPVTPTHPIPTVANVERVGPVPRYWSSGTYYTDGSGGEMSSYPMTQR